MKEQSFRIKVPGSTSNIGPGFDSIGIALNVYLTITCRPSDEWYFEQKKEKFEHLPTGKDNLLYECAEYVAKKFGFESLPPYFVEMDSEIPVARGLGSSGAITVAGVELANQILDLNLSLKEKMFLASEMEGHPDNVSPSYVGGCVVAYFNEDALYYTEKRDMDQVDFVAAIPDFELRTKTAREILPKELSFKKSIEGSAIGNVSTAAIMQSDYRLLGEVMEMDLFHQSYRKDLIPHYHDLLSYMRNEGAYGTFLSGAGPTMISICEKGMAADQREKWQKDFPDLEWKILKVEEKGLTIEKG